MATTEQDMLTAEQKRKAEFEALKAELKRRSAMPITEEEKARRRVIFEEFKRLRDSTPSLPPGTVAQWVRETRDEQEERTDPSRWRL